MKNRLIALILSAVVLTAVAPAAAAAAPSVHDASRTLAALDVMTGNESGDLMLGRAVTRAEFTKMLVAMSVYKDSVGQADVSPYPDVPRTHWAASHIAAAVGAGYVTGYIDGTFGPQKTVTLAEGVTMAVRLLGYSDSDFSGTFPTGQMALYRSLKLNKAVTASANSDPLTRSDAMFILYNLLTAKNKAGMVHLTTLGHALTASGEIDQVALINESMDGPVVAGANWQAELSFPVGTVYRKGSPSTISAVQSGDVLYWSKSMRTVWAYNSTVTGTYQSASPSAAAPAAVTVAGRSYTIETAGAAFDLSTLGSFRTGDTVTLLLGRDGGVAAVQPAGQTASGAVYGIVLSSGPEPFTDENGNAHTAPAVTVAGTDGLRYTYKIAPNLTYTPGELVQVSVSSGGTSVSRLTSASLSGRVNPSSTKLGSYELSGDIEILDTYEGSALRVYPSRLAGVALQSSMVRFYVLDSGGKISRLILADVTGDLHKYGVVTSSYELASGMALAGSYVYDIGGVVGAHSLRESIFGASEGPCKFVYKDGALSGISNLSSVRLTSLSGNTGLSASSAYTLADGVAVYELKDGNYYLSSLDRVGSGYRLTGWYDKAEIDGGRIRVILAIAAAD